MAIDTCNSAIINIFLDFLVLGLPIAQLWKMNLNTRKKLLVMLMFGMGFFVTITSILRLRAIVGYGKNGNFTYVRVEPGLWVSLSPLDRAKLRNGSNRRLVQAGTPAFDRVRLHARNSPGDRESPYPIENRRTDEQTKLQKDS